MVTVSTSLRVTTTSILSPMVLIELYGLVLVEQVLARWVMELNNTLLMLVVGLFQNQVVPQLESQKLPEPMVVLDMGSSI